MDLGYWSKRRAGAAAHLPWSRRPFSRYLRL